jgi:hypothetical protein
MEPNEDAIVDIPKDRLRFFGGAGKMLAGYQSERRTDDSVSRRSRRSGGTPQKRGLHAR